MAETQVDDTTEAISRLENRAYTTYNCRLYAFRRLTRANNAWNMALIAFSTSTTVAAVGMLVERNMYGRGGDALMVALAILSLVASLVVSSVGFGTRAKAMESNYKRIQQISVAAEDLKSRFPSDRVEQYDKLRRDYEVAVDSSENHTSRDFDGLRRDQLSRKERTAVWYLRSVLHRLAPIALPLITLAVRIAVLIPFASWYSDGF